MGMARFARMAVQMLKRGQAKAQARKAVREHFGATAGELAKDVTKKAAKTYGAQKVVSTAKELGSVGKPDLTQFQRAMSPKVKTPRDAAKNAVDAFEQNEYVKTFKEAAEELKKKHPQLDGFIEAYKQTELKKAMESNNPHSLKGFWEADLATVEDTACEQLEEIRGNASNAGAYDVASTAARIVGLLESYKGKLSGVKDWWNQYGERLRQLNYESFLKGGGDAFSVYDLLAALEDALADLEDLISELEEE